MPPPPPPMNSTSLLQTMVMHGETFLPLGATNRSSKRAYKRPPLFFNSSSSLVISNLERNRECREESCCHLASLMPCRSSVQPHVQPSSKLLNTSSPAASFHISLVRELLEATPRTPFSTFHHRRSSSPPNQVVHHSCHSPSHLFEINIIT